MSDLEQVKLLQSVLAARGAGSNPEEDLVWVAFVHDLDPMVRLVIKKRLACRNDVEDLAQDVWIALIRRLPKLHYDPARGTLRAWVAGVARHLAGKHARRRSRHHDAILTPKIAAGLLNLDADPATQFRRKQRREQVEAMLAEVSASLSELSHRIIVMRWVDGRKVREIAAVLGVPESVVKMRLHRARRELRGLLRGGKLGSVDDLW